MPSLKNLSELSVGFSCITCGKRPYLITLPVSQSVPQAFTSSCLLTSTAGEETPSEAVKTPRTCRLRMIMQLFALRLRLMEAKMTTLRFFDLLFSSRQTRFLLNTCRKCHVPWIFTQVAQTFEELEPSGGGGGMFGIFWCLFDALWVSTGLLFCMQSHFQARESINHTVPFRSISLFLKKKTPSQKFQSGHHCALLENHQ